MTILCKLLTKVQFYQGMHISLWYIECTSVFLQSNNQNHLSRVLATHHFTLHTPKLDQKCTEFNNYRQKNSSKLYQLSFCVMSCCSECARLQSVVWQLAVISFGSISKNSRSYNINDTCRCYIPYRTQQTICISKLSYLRNSQLT